MDNNEQNKTPSGLSEENLKWLEEMADSKSPTPEINVESTSETAPEQNPSPALENTEDQSKIDDILDEILSTDWDNIKLPEDSEEIKQPNDMIIVPEEEPEVKTEPTQEPPRKVNKDTEPKGRPEKKSSYRFLGIPHVLTTLIWLALILAIGVSMGRVLWVCCADVMAFGKTGEKVTITITADDTIDTISKKLGQADLVKYPKLFKFFATVTGKDEDICVGTFTLSPQLDYNAMINAMYSYESKRGVVDIMFPEGYNCAQIFKALEAKGVCTVAELEEYAANGELKEYWFLEGVSRGDKYCLEGYLAPDTYTFYLNDSPRRVLEKFLNEFDDRFTDKMKESFKTIQSEYAARLRKNGFSAAYIEENTLTLHQVITLASVVQKETSSDDEGYKIAAVFYARLSDPKIMSLGADITVHYALGDYFYDIQELTVEQLEFDSPYNTRKNKGIPPGPICNMGVQSLYAVLEPNENYYQYRYFVYDRTNKVHVFTKTESEHNRVKKELGY